jgi:hypothetical protein
MQVQKPIAASKIKCDFFLYHSQNLTQTSIEENKKTYYANALLNNMYCILPAN